MKLDTSSYYPKSPLDTPENEYGASEDSLFHDKKSEISGSPEIETFPGSQPETESSDPISAPELPPTAAEKSIDAVSTFLSWILVPLLMPVFGLLLAFNESILAYTPVQSKWVFTIITAIINIAIPALLIYLLKRLGLVDDIGLNGRKERLIPYIITVLCMGATAWFMASKMAPMWLVMFFVGGACAGVINLIVNFRWKISAHAAGIAGVVALLIRIIYNGMPQPGITLWLVITIIAAGLLGSARVWLGRHTPAQVLAGYAVGFCSVFFLTMIGLE